MKLKQLTLATAATLALCVTASANTNAPSHSTMIDKDEYAAKPHHHKKHHQCCNDGYNPDWTKGWYIGAGVNGDSEMSNETPTAQLPWALTDIGGTDFEKSDNDVGFDVYVGRKVSRHFAFQMGYTMVGNQTFTSENTDDFDGEITVKQWNVNAVGLVHMPIGHYFNVFLKGGVAYYQNSTDFDISSTSESFEDNSTLNTFAFTYGAGVELNVDQFGVRGEYTAIEPNNTSNNFYVSDTVGASIFYRFM